MKDDFENMNVDLEQLLRSKQWSQLNETERNALTDLVDGEKEYERMQGMVHRLRAVSGVHDLEMTPSGHVRENLLMAFDDEQRRRRGLWLTGIGFWFRDRLRLDIPAVRLAMASVVIAVGIVAVVKLMNGENPGQTIAKHDQQTLPADHQNGNDPQLNPVPLNVDSGTVQSPVVKQAPEQSNDQLFIQFEPAPGANNPAPIVPVDTTTQRLASNLPVDTAAIVMPLVTATQSFAVCCAPTNVLVAPTANGASYNWTSPTGTNTVLVPSSYNVTIVGLPPRSRSLEQDADVVNVFFALK